eukprot:comp23275_c0_seq1/m.38100 comp23275_c0_seq1/g.38100  ORF comp23275_c0_seq1/g.38100 comp23275_c0_seq1/m.38100 type:complete len:747 (-) comp23275_c0_seq1:220-2460(-)
MLSSKAALASRTVRLVARASQKLPARNFMGAAYNLAKKAVPKMSDTERAALDAGTVGFDRELFGGSPRLGSLMKYDAVLSEKEKSFLANEVEVLCNMLDDYQIQKDMDMPPHVWKYIKENRFLGMIVPEEKGGLGFSPYAHSLVVQKIATRSVTAAVTVSVPNSLGPAELLMKYGTDEQRSHYLPRLAVGKDVPCFALTGPHSGSDAASMPDSGMVCVKNGRLGVSVTFNKRYITLAPIASVVGLAFVLQDPEGLLKGVGKEGISLALLPRDTPGLQLGERHDTLSIAFMNGTVKGTNVFIPMDYLIGGQKYAGFGWNMLMECLSEGRGISLPASSAATGRASVAAVGAYARIRKQFKVPIAELEGVQERLARIAAEAYTMNAATTLMCAILGSHERPSVLSAIMKQQCTEKGRTVINEAMDIVGGAGICKGPRNLLATPYQATPVAITVEGSNTLTRSLIIFGQGLVRAHPYLLNVMESIQRGNDIKGFTKGLNQMVSHATTNAARSVKRAVTRRRLKGNDLVGYYESQLERLASAFAVNSDLALTMGGRLKTAEFVSGRYADALSGLYLGYACLWYHMKNPVADGDAVLEVAMDRILSEVQEALHGAARNFPIRPVGWLMSALAFPFGKSYSLPTDRAVREAAKSISTETAVRRLLIEHVFVPANRNEQMSMLLQGLPLAVKADRILADCKRNKRTPSQDEQATIDAADAIRNVVVQVDAFPALGRAEWERVLASEDEPMMAHK